MFNLLAVRSAAIPRLEAQLAAAADAGERLVISDQLEHERRKQAQGKMENALRRHNMLPLVLDLFKALNESKIKSESGWWNSLTAAEVVDAARAKGKERRDKDKERKAREGK